MKKNLAIYSTALTLLAALAVPMGLTAQDQPEVKNEHHHYQLVDVGTLGGPNSSNAFAGIGTKTMNSRGTVTGVADTSATDPYCIFYPDCFLNHPFQWQDGVLTDLGALPGPANTSFAFWINSRGWIAGESLNGVINPLTGNPEEDAVLWKDGQIINLGTMGGNASVANAVNNRGQVVGAALNTVLDPFSSGFPAPNCGSALCPCICESYTALLFQPTTEMHAVLWQNGAIKDLGTLGGPDSIATHVNERGQIAGESYLNSTPNATTGVPTIDPFFIGEDGKMVDLGNLGGTVGWLTGLNNRGEVIGAMTLAGDAERWHPFLWSNGILTDLGTLGADCGNATAINDAGEVVGLACSPTTFFPTLWKGGVLINLGLVAGDTAGESDDINSEGQVVGESGPDIGLGHAWLWENGGPTIDLNTLIPPGSGIQLTHAVSINDSGEISGDGVLPSGDNHAFVLIPCDENHPDVESCDYSLVDASTAVEADSAPVTMSPSVAPQNDNSPIGLRGQVRGRSAHRYPGIGVQPPK